MKKKEFKELIESSIEEIDVYEKIKSYAFNKRYEKVPKTNLYCKVFLKKCITCLVLVIAVSLCIIYINNIASSDSSQDFINESSEKLSDNTKENDIDESSPCKQIDPPSYSDEDYYSKTYNSVLKAYEKNKDDFSINVEDAINSYYKFSEGKDIDDIVSEIMSSADDTINFYGSNSLVKEEVEKFIRIAKEEIDNNETK